MAPIKTSYPGPGGLLRASDATDVESMSGEPELFTLKEWASIEQRLGLTARQGELLRLLIAGQSDQRIAKSLGISPHTVRAHLQRIFEVCGVNDRAMLVVATFKAFRALSVE